MVRRIERLCREPVAKNPRNEFQRPVCAWGNRFQNGLMKSRGLLDLHLATGNRVCARLVGNLNSTKLDS